MADILARQRQIHGSTADWSANNLVLGDGELALERRTDGTVRARVGNGALPFSAAPYLAGGDVALVYRGNADPTLAPPAGAAAGDLYTANPGGVAHAGWGPPVAGTTIAAGSYLAKAASGVWSVIPATVDLSAYPTRTELADDDGAALVGLPAGTVGAALTPTRTAPHANFAFALAIVPTLVSDGPGRYLAGTNLRTSWDTTYPPASFSGGAVVRHLSYFGSDAADGSNLANAKRTIGATRTVNGVTVQLHPDGPITPGDVRYADTNPSAGLGGQPRRFITQTGRSVVGFEGDNLAAATFAPAGTTYSTTLATANVLHRLLRNDVLDRNGFPMPIPRAASAAAVTTSTYGWYFDAATKVLTVRVGSLNIETAFKTKLVPIYTGPDASVANRIYLESTRTIWENIDFVGVYVHAISVAGQPQAKAWFRNCRFLYAPATAITANGAEIVTQDCYFHRPAGDGITYNDDVAGFTCRGLELGGRAYMTGDEDSYPGQVTNPVAASAYQKQASSVHSGNVVTFGGYHDGSAGPLIQDTGGYRWLEATEFGYPVDAAGTAAIGMLLQGGQFWLSHVNLPTAKSGAYVATDGAVVRQFRCTGPAQAASGASFVPYTPAT